MTSLTFSRASERADALVADLLSPVTSLTAEERARAREHPEFWRTAAQWAERQGLTGFAALFAAEADAREAQP